MENHYNHVLHFCERHIFKGSLFKKRLDIYINQPFKLSNISVALETPIMVRILCSVKMYET